MMPEWFFGFMIKMAIYFATFSCCNSRQPMIENKREVPQVEVEILPAVTHRREESTRDEDWEMVSEDLLY